MSDSGTLWMTPPPACEHPTGKREQRDAPFPGPEERARLVRVAAAAVGARAGGSEIELPGLLLFQPEIAYVEGRWTSDVGRTYTIRVQLHAAYPDLVPSVYIMDPYPLVGFGARSMHTYGSSHGMHTFESDIPSATRICIVRPEIWDARWLISSIILRTLLWILAYEFQCDDGTPVGAFLID
jgi:hypothetical protein